MISILVLTLFTMTLKQVFVSDCITLTLAVSDNQRGYWHMIKYDMMISVAQQCVFKVTSNISHHKQLVKPRQANCSG